MAIPQHAFFGVSKFTYLGRNGTFLDLIGLRKRPLDRLVLLGSGPIEPFEIATLPCFRDIAITAIDCDKDVNKFVCDALNTGQLNVNNLARVCRSADRVNNYLLSNDRLIRQLDQVRQQGLHAHWDGQTNTVTLPINRELKDQLKMVLCDLQKHIPYDVSQADVVFEGFMLVNWAKREDSSPLSELFLKRLHTKMSPRSWFASATSVTHYLGDFAGSKPFLRQALSAGFLPAAGVMMKWSVGEGQQITSQFGSVFSVTDRADQPLFQLGRTFEQDTLHWISTFDVQHQWKTVGIDRLADLLEAGDVLCFRSLEDGRFKVVTASWADLSRQCGFKNRPYELKLDSEE